ncbi:unnamed protein product [Trichobilharzia regenti]|nr:unnamed protein product [Trichobilharzia regenti]
MVYVVASEQMLADSGGVRNKTMRSCLIQRIPPNPYLYYHDFDSVRSRPSIHFMTARERANLAFCKRTAKDVERVGGRVAATSELRRQHGLLQRSAQDFVSISIQREVRSKCASE